MIPRTRSPAPLAVLLLASLAMGQEDEHCSRRCRELCEAALAGRLDAQAMAAAIAADDEAVARTAAAIVRHSWAELPEALLAALDADPRAAARLLDEFARAPRPAATGWATRQGVALPGRSVDHRLLALAARGAPLTAQDAALLLEAVRSDQAGDGYHLALRLLPPEVADALLGRLHQGLMHEQLDVDRLAFLLDRLSPRGVKSLLGLAVTLPPDTARALCRRVHEQRPELVRERVVAALDGEVPLEPLWLEFAGPLLDRPPRVERVLAALRDGEHTELGERAFDALLAAKRVDEAVLAVAIDQSDSGEARIRRVLARAGDAVPAERLAAWLHGTPEVQAAVAQVVLRRAELAPALQTELLRLLRGVDQVDAGTALAVLTALVQRGDAAALAEVWPKVLRSGSWMTLLDALGHRDEPFVAECLLAAIADFGPVPDADPRREQLDMMRLLLVGRGDRRELEALVRNAPAASPQFLRRCRAHANPLPAAHVAGLLAAAFAAEDPEVAVELCEWVATNREPATVEAMWQLWNDPPDIDAGDALQEVALRVLAQSDRRDALVARLRDALADGPLPESMSALPYELLNSMAEPLSASDLQLAAELVLLPPIGDPDGELRLCERWPDGAFGFPLVAAVASRLRTADPEAAGRAFDAVVARVAADPRAANVSRQRLKVFWRAMVVDPALQDRLGRATVALWRFVEPFGDDAVGDGAAHWLAGRSAELRGEHGAAAAHYERAVAELLWRPETHREARWLCGERDPAAGDDPWAALAAAPHVMRMRAARSAGDPAGAAAAAALAREFAGADRATLDLLSDSPLPSEDPGR